MHINYSRTQKLENAKKKIWGFYLLDSRLDNNCTYLNKATYIYVFYVFLMTPVGASGKY